ncbi:MAG: polymerase, partial [Jatrophihabitantaceae bacterium]|nr:polymerase [Jatrophihabitantaceae bacterium]
MTGAATQTDPTEAPDATAPDPTAPDGAGARLLLLDGHSLAYRAFFALREVDMSTTTGQPTNAVFGFTSMLINLLRDEEPTHVAVAFDVSRKTFRSDVYAEYKAGRSETPSDFRGQVELIREVLDALRIPVVTAEGYEADDVIATITTRAAAAGAHVLICTGDRDALQLVTPNVTVLYPRKGVSDLTRFTPEEVQSKYDLSPSQYPDFAALRGDPSDNLPGIPGVGEKTASKWIREFGSFTELVDRVDEVKGKVGDALREHLASVIRNRSLTELVRDVPGVDATLGDLARVGWDRDEVHTLFDNLQFRVLRERLFATVAAVAPEAEEGFDVAVRRLGPDEVAGWLGEHARDGRRVGVSFRGTWGRGTGQLDGVALAASSPDAVAGADADSSVSGACAAIDAVRLTAEDEQALADWLADADVPKAVHDVKGPLSALAARGWSLDGVTSDTQLAAYLALPG